MMLNEVSDGCESSDGDAIVAYLVEETVIVGFEGVIGWTGRERDWYHASTLYPNFCGFWLAPATAKRGDAKNAFAAVSILEC